MALIKLYELIEIEFTNTNKFENKFLNMRKFSKTKQQNP